MSLHTFLNNNPPNIGRQFYGNAAPTAPDGNTYVIGDVIWFINVPIGTAAPAGSPLAWICVLGGAGGTAQWLAFGSSQSVPTSAFSNTAGVTQSALPNGDTILKFTIPFSALPAGASPVQVSLFTPPAKSLIEKVSTKHSVAFSGGGITGMTVAVGTAATAALYSPAFNVYQAVAGNTFQVTVDNSIDSLTAPAAVVATFASTGANPNAATAGSVDIYLWVTASTV